MVDWGMVAIPVTFVAGFTVSWTPYVINGIATLVQRIVRRCVRPVRLKWQDIPDGRLHECPRARHALDMAFCMHIGSDDTQHRRALCCWNEESSIARAFSCGWRQSLERPQYAKHLPEALPVNCTFICTDGWTVLAFVLFTAGVRYGGGWDRYMSWNESKVALQSIEGCTVAHVEGRLRSECAKLTKHEVELMLRGWPPWYRQTFKTYSNVVISFPIDSTQDIPRGGWILAVGLMNPNLDSQIPLELYRSQRRDGYLQSPFRGPGDIFRDAVKRCRDHIEKNILPHFFAGTLERTWVDAALEALDYLVIRNTGSGMPNGLGRRWSPDIGHLQKSDCEFVMKNFNQFEPFSPADRERLTPILRPTLAAAVHGGYEVVQYLKDVGTELEVPPLLTPLDREVWLRDCTTRLPNAH